MLVDAAITFPEVSCPSTSFCGAAGGFGKALTYDGSSWSKPADIDGNSWVSSVSCSSSSFCVAVDWSGQALTYDGNSWSAPVDIDGTNRIIGVSCASSSFCVAVDEAGNALVYHSSSWSEPVEIDGGNGLSSVSCPSISFCAAVDEEGNALTFDGSAWSDPVGIDNGVVYGLNSVSCPSVSFCVAGDGDGNALTYSDDSPMRSYSAGSTKIAGAQKARRDLGRANIGRAKALGTSAGVPVTCIGSSDATCTITLSMRTGSRRPITLGRKTAQLKAGHRRLVRVALNKAGRRLLEAHHRLSATLTISQEANSGIAVVASQLVSFSARG